MIKIILWFLMPIFARTFRARSSIHLITQSIKNY